MDTILDEILILIVVYFGHRFYNAAFKEGVLRYTIKDQLLEAFVDQRFD